MMTTDLALIGRLGDGAVAAVGLAHLILFFGFVLGMGLVSAVAPLAAQASVRASRAWCAARCAWDFGRPSCSAFRSTLRNCGARTSCSRPDRRLKARALAARYLAGLAWSMIPAWCFIALRNFMGAVNRPEPALWVTLAAIPVNAVLAYALIHGSFGLPRLDLLGAGLATTIVNVGMCVAAVWICYACRPFKKYRVLGRFWRADWELMRQLIVIGLPISGAFMLEWGLFSSAALLVGWIGTTALAAHQIALQVASILFMVPFGISLAATVRVGHAVGRRDRVAGRRAGFVAIALGAVFMLATTLIVVAFRDVIPSLFLGGDGAANAATAELAATLLLIGASFFVDRRRAGNCGRRAARAQRHPRADAVRRHQLLAHRLHQRLCAGISGGLRRDRHLDRILARCRHLCRVADRAIPSEDRGRRSVAAGHQNRWMTPISMIPGKPANAREAA